MIKDEIDGKELLFCCKGCQGVYHLLHQEGLDSFYDKIHNNQLSQPVDAKDDVSRFDLDSFEKSYIKTRDDGMSEIHLIIEGIHCSACVWLNEKVLYEKDGIYEASINYTNNKAKIIWDRDKLKLSDIINIIRAIGYNAYPYDTALEEKFSAKSKRDYFVKMIIAIFATMNIMMLAIAKYAGFFSGIDDDVKNIIHIGEIFLTTPVLFYSGSIFFKGAYYGLKNRFINMDLLVSTGAILVYIYSIYAMITLSGETYFDSVTMIITFVMVGKYLEELSKKRAVDTLDRIKSKLPTQVMVLRDGKLVSIDVDEVKVGDTIEVRSGDKCVIDGEIISGEGNFDESSLTGESKPIYKKDGDKVISGTINLDGLIRYKAIKSYKDSTILTILNLIENSLSKKPQIEQMANELSKYFSVAILTISIATFLGWYFYVSSGFENSFIIAISVIVIACPCALALATPVATLVGLGEASKRGVLFKEAKFIETMAKADVVVFDKTGTLTKGTPTVKEVTIIDKNYINELYTLVNSSNHPVSQGVKLYLQNSYSSLKELELKEFKVIEAKGIKASIDGKKLLGGSGRLFDIKDSHTTFIFSVDGVIVAKFTLDDEVKDGAKELIEYLNSQNIPQVMLTGDNEEVASNIAKEIGINKYYSHMTPITKAEYIDRLKRDNKRVVMVGDGINDALSLSKSDIAISMGSGADVSIDVSDIILLNNSLKSLIFSFKISIKTFRFIKQNLTISLIYNLITIPLAVLGYVIPLIAALSMSVSSLLVVGNSMRIKK
jgi:Cu+-exporting ATPase